MLTKVTKYKISSENDYPNNPIIPVLDQHRNILAVISPECFASAALEGCCKLKDGRVINVSGGWVPSTPDITQALKNIANKWYKGRNGYAGLSPSGKFYFTFGFSTTKYGIGSHGNALIPFKTVAADPDVYPYNTKLIIKELIGMVMPDNSIHDGNVVVGDVGSAIKGNAHIDFFVGTSNWYLCVNLPDMCDVEVV